MRLRWSKKSTEPAPAKPLSEPGLRRPDFVEGEPITLGNGEAWHFPRPVIEFRLQVQDGTLKFRDKPRMGDGRLRDFGEHYWKLCDTVNEATNGLDRLNGYALLAIDLLRRNYVLTDDQVIGLLPFAQDDKTNQEMWREIIDVCEGRGKEPDADGESS